MSKEYGRLGQKRYGGTFYEEFLPGTERLEGCRSLPRMSENDDVVGAVLTAVELLLRQASWRVDPGGARGKGCRGGGVCRPMPQRYAGYLDGYDFRDPVVSDLWVVIP